MKILRNLLLLAPLLGAGCVASSYQNVTLPDGPPVQTISTPYDRLISCIAEYRPMKGVWAVGEILDATGKFNTDYSGSGKFISQGAGDMMQTILVQANADVTVNRRDPRPVLTEIQLGIRTAKTFRVMDYFITGSVNTLDFIPGAAAEITVGGIGPRYRQNRALVGLDLHLTDAQTTEVLSAVNISKQIFADEVGFGVGRFFGNTLVDLDLNGQNREPLQLSLRSMLQYGLYEILANLQPALRDRCQQIVDHVEGVEDRGSSHL